MVVVVVVVTCTSTVVVVSRINTLFPLCLGLPWNDGVECVMPGEDPSNAFRSREDVGAFATWCNFGVNNKYFNDSMVNEVGDPFFTSLTDDGTAQIQVG